MALRKLPSSQRETLLLVGASGFTYEQAAAICEISVGTVRSRVSRARTRLVVLLALDSADRFGPHDAGYFGQAARLIGRRPFADELSFEGSRQGRPG